MLRMFLLLFITAAEIAGARGGSLHLDLLRRAPPPHVPRIEHLRQLALSDRLRQQSISARLSGDHRRRRTCETNASSSFAMPMGSGAYAGTGQYFVRAQIGTPAQKFVLVADTGSDLTWMKCRYRRRTCSQCAAAVPGNRRRPFDANKSSTFKPISCSSELCRTTLPFSLTTCPAPASPCSYDYGYSDGSSAQGIYANESATVVQSDGRRTKLRGLLVGCSSSFSGASFNAADGVLGLGHSAISFASRATGIYGGRFSYCLVDHLSPRNASSYLTFGANKAFSPSSARTTQLLLEPTLEPFYGAGVEGISVAGEVLKIPLSVWDASRGGGVIVDSGTSLTVLTEPAYSAVVSALSRRLGGLPRVKIDPFEYCYNWTAGGSSVSVPELVVHFNGSARLEPLAKSYLIDVADGVKCIGLTSATFPGVSTIGNILQQDHLWEFDIKNRRLRFQRSACLF